MKTLPIATLLCAAGLFCPCLHAEQDDGTSKRSSQSPADQTKGSTDTLVTSQKSGDAALPDAKNMTAKQLNALDRSVISRLSAGDCMTVGFAKDRPERNAAMLAEMVVKKPLMDLYCEVELWSKDGFNAIRYKESVKEFQKKLNEAQTGVLTMGQLDQAEKYAKALDQEEIYPSGDLMLIDLGETVSVQGTLTIVGDKIAWPINLVRGVARKSTMIYEETFTYLDHNTIYSSTDSHEIIQWGDEEIIAIKQFGERNLKVLINRKTQSVSYITTDRSTDTKSGSQLDKLGQPRVSILKSGFDAARDHYQNEKTKAREFMADRAKAIF